MRPERSSHRRKIAVTVLLSQCALAVLVAVPAHAAAADPDVAPPGPPPGEAPPPPPEPPPVARAEIIEAPGLPDTPRTAAPPPVPQAQVIQVPAPAPIERPGVQLTAAPPRAAVDGQWVYTTQYGWVWMAYAQSYTYVPDDGDAVMYVYGPTFGWQWVAAPWVFDLGPAPYWGVRGRSAFIWYSHPWFARRPYPRAYYHRHYVYDRPRFYGSARVYSPRYASPRYYAPRYSAPRSGSRYSAPRESSRSREGRRTVIVRPSGGHSHGHRR